MVGLRTFAIVGGGPAGATAARRLLQSPRPLPDGESGIRVVVFEEKPGWEKPCGGGLSGKALKAYPFLRPASGHANPVWKMEMRAPGGVVARFRLREPLVVYSRRELNHLLLQRSIRAGAEVVTDRIVNVARVGNEWLLSGRSGSYQADFLILAGGARSGLRNSLAGPLSAGDFMLTFGYYIEGHEDLMRIEFFDRFEGYAWSFPREGHLSVGICGKAGEYTMADLKLRLAQFMRSFGYSRDSAPVFSHLLPSLGVESWGRNRFEGDGWGMAGDVAGFVDPITGEGLYYAMRSGELLADSILKGSSYTQSVWNEFGAGLVKGARACHRFYGEEFLGAGVPTRMIQLCGRSRVFQNVFQDLVEGSQEYHGLRNRLLRCLPRFAAEMAGQSFACMVGAQSSRQN